MSTVDKNLRARANSNKPRVTFTEVIQPPALGRVFNQPGKAANKAKGRAKATENPNMPKRGATLLPVLAASTNKVPISGPVQLKETSDKVKAIKKMPSNPPLLAFLSTAFKSLLGSIISKAPKNEMAKTTKMKKKSRFQKALVAMAFRASEPNILVMANPKAV